MKRKIEPSPEILEENKNFALEIVCENSPMLFKKDISSLQRTCKFFSTQKRIKAIKEAKPWCEMVTAGMYHTFLLAGNGRPYFTGARHGKIKLGAFYLMDRVHGFESCLIDCLKKDEFIVQIASSENQSLFLSSKGQLIVRGDNRCGQLGATDKIVPGFKSIPLNMLEPGECITQMQTGGYHSVLLTNKGRLVVSGSNEYGQLGMPEAHFYVEFTLCALTALKEGEYPVKVVVGQYSTFLLTSSNRLLMAGYEGFSLRPPTEDEDFDLSFKEISIEGLALDEYVVQIAAGLMSTLLLTNKGNLLGFSYKQSSEDDCFIEEGFVKRNIEVLEEGEIPILVESAMSGEQSFILTNKGRLLVSGENSYGQLGLPEEIDSVETFTECELPALMKGESVLRIVAGDRHTLIVTSKDRILGCGNNLYGQLTSSDGRTEIYGFEECNRNANALDEEEDQLDLTF